MADTVNSQITVLQPRFRFCQVPLSQRALSLPNTFRFRQYLESTREAMARLLIADPELPERGPHASRISLPAPTHPMILIPWSHPRILCFKLCERSYRRGAFKGCGEGAAPWQSSVEEAEDLASHLLSPGLLVVEDARGGGHHKVTELAGGEQPADPALDLVGGKVVAGGDHAALVQATVELDHDLAGATVVDDLELANVT